MTVPTRLPANEGAHQLAWWLAGASAPARLRLLRSRAGVSEALARRLLDGSVQPAEPVAVLIAEATEGAVRPEDWEAAASGGWADRPAPRPH